MIAKRLAQRRSEAGRKAWATRITKKTETSPMSFQGYATIFSACRIGDEFVGPYARLLGKFEPPGSSQFEYAMRLAGEAEPARP